ncbi:hypothetical protein RM844_14745 [Streptomyces sp. DSM 44915]|uniref:Uncharacterized protein n=1 Tax=Streptomyces chisholmiae TaxID=3075540 RepID=A0ABU2JRF2_9ACTN|nr:hypothetical protein [Streptomyces sp. DSM 44915]MDT0267545.1 hypothetical protein [Streptomyces sp. DSM 44915]
MNSELSRMRGDLRDTRKVLADNGVDLSKSVHTLLETLQQEIRDLREAVRDAGSEPLPGSLEGRVGLGRVDALLGEPAVAGRAGVDRSCRPS